MATTVSSTATANMQAKDGSVTRATSWQLNDFGDLAVPAGATVNGIELLIWMAGGGLNSGDTYFKVNNGTSDSSAKAANEFFTAFSTYSDMTVGAADDLWGLSWTPTTANDITARWNVSYGTGGTTGYFDHVEVRITYTEAVIPQDLPITITSGKISLTSGLITI
jgi:hypothetical protein